MEPQADGFRNYKQSNLKASAEELLIDKAQLMTLTAPELVVLIGGMRVLNTNFNQSHHGVFTKQPEALTNDFFANLIDFSTTWKTSAQSNNVFEGSDRSTGTVKWTATRVDLILGSNSELRALAEVYACEDAKAKLMTNQFDILFLDINLNGISAFDLLNYIPASTKVIFVTAYSDFVTRALRIKALI